MTNGKQERSVEERLAELEAQMKVLQASIGAIAKASASGKSQTTGIDPAPDRILDGPGGDPEIRFDPKFWKGEPQVGKRFSQTSPSYLEAYANLSAWKMNNPPKDASEEEKKKKAGYAKWDAMKALGWKRRLEDGYKPTAHDTQPPAGDDEIPF